MAIRTMQEQLDAAKSAPKFDPHNVHVCTVDGVEVRIIDSKGISLSLNGRVVVKPIRDLYALLSTGMETAVTPGFPPETPEQERSMRRDRYPPRFVAPEPKCRDKERIDWLEMMANKPAGILLHSEGNSTGRLGLGLAMPTRSLRDAIDQAMEFRD